jgi:hypothetical protein
MKAFTIAMALCIGLLAGYSGAFSPTAYADTVTTPFGGDLEDGLAFVRPMLPGDIVDDFGGDYDVWLLYTLTWFYHDGASPFWMTADNEWKIDARTDADPDRYTRNYFIRELIPTASGNYTITVLESRGGIATTLDDTTLFLYKGSFNPLKPMDNLYAGNDDMNGDRYLSQLVDIPLEKDTKYYLVMTSFSSSTEGQHVEFDAVGPGLLTVIDPEDGEPPVIAAHPADALVNVGDDALFEVEADGMLPLSYQWQVDTQGGSNFQNISDDAVYSGAAASALNLVSVTEDMDGYTYRVIVTDANGLSSTSNAATLRINHPPVFLETDPTLTVLVDDEPVDLNDLLRARDTDPGQTLVWKAASPPDFGTLTIVGATASSGEEEIFPGGTMTYEPPGHEGIDTFMIEVDDGYATALISVAVTIVEKATVSSVVLPPDGTYKAGDPLEFTVKFNLPVTVDGTPQLSLTVGNKPAAADYVSGTNTRELLFRYIAEEGDLDEDGISVDALHLNEGSIKTRSVDADLTLHGIGETSQVKVDAVAPFVKGVTSSKADGAYKAGTVIPIEVTFSEPVVVTGTPRLTLETGNNDRTTDFTSADGATLVFEYTVQAGDASDDLDYASAGALSLNGGTIKDAAGNPALLTLPDPGAEGSLGAGKAIIIDTKMPKVTSVSVPPAGIYVAGQALEFVVAMDEPVTVTGVPTLILTIGEAFQAAFYIDSVSESELKFRYTIAPGDADDDGIAAYAMSLPAGAGIADAAGNAAVLTLNGVGDTSGILVDAVAPQVTGVSVPAAGTYTLGETLTFTVHFSEDVVVETDNGTPALPLVIGTSSVKAVYVSGTGTNEIVFEYVVKSGDEDTDGIALGSAIELSGGTMADLTGNGILPQLNNAGDTTGILVDAGAKSVEAIPASSSPAAGASNVIALTVRDALGNPVTAFDGEYDVTVSGQEEAPDHTFGSIDEEPLTGAATTMTVRFTAGQATVDLKLNKADAQSITFDVAGVPSTDTVDITPVAGPAVSMELTVDIAPPASNGGTFGQQPVVTLVDRFGNVSVHDDSTVVTVVKEDSGTWSLTGTTSGKAEGGVVTFADLGAANAAEVTGARIAFEAEGLPAITSSTVTLPWPTLEAPVIETAAHGNGKVRIEWSPVYGAVSYLVYMRTASTDYGTEIADVTDTVYDATDLMNGTAYYFIVKAVNPAGISPASNEVSATPQVPPPPVLRPGETVVEVLVNGQAERAGTARTTVVDGRKHVTVTVDPARIEEKLAAEGEGTVMTIPVLSQADVAAGELTGQIIKRMEQNQAVVEIKTEQATYTLPAGQIRIDAVAELFGGNVNLEEVKIRIEIAEPDADQSDVLRRLGTDESLAVVVPPLEFRVTATFGDQTVEVSRFNAFVERTIAIPEDEDPGKITTGIAVEPDGESRHVPTRIVVIDGKHFAKINSLTNSLYAVVWHPLAFRDMAGHWAEEAVNDMGSRMVVSGVGNGNFAPNLPITRAEFAAIIVRGLGLAPEEGTVPFTDVKRGDWYAGAVRTAHEYGLMQGYADGTFRPAERITREQAMVIIARAMAITGLTAEGSPADAETTLASFTDAAGVSGWAKSGVAAGIQAGIVSGRADGRIAPGDPITRAEVAVIVRKLLQKSGLI